MSDRIPGWLSDAVRAHPRPTAARPIGPIKPGDLCLVSTDDDTRIVLVLEVDRWEGLASIVLATNDVDLRTDQDLLITPAELGLPYALAIETDLIGPVRLGDLTGHRLGSLRVAVEPFAHAAQTGEQPATLDGREGTPLRGPSDARWSWKDGEGAFLDAVVVPLDADVRQPAAIAALIAALRAAVPSTSGVRATRAVQRPAFLLDAGAADWRMEDVGPRFVRSADLRANAAWIAPAADGPGPRPADALRGELVSLLLGAAAVRSRLPAETLQLLARPESAALVDRDTCRAIEPLFCVA